MANKKVVKWLSNRTCDFCHKECDKDHKGAFFVYNGVFEVEYQYILDLYAERMKKNDFL